MELTEVFRAEGYKITPQLNHIDLGTGSARFDTMLDRRTQTHRNLREAFARESEANRRYLWFAHQADVEGYPEIAALFRSVAEGETGHAHGLLEFLAEIGDPATGEPIGDTEDNLRAAVAGETHDHAEMYPAFARTARDEGLEAIAEWFETLARAEKSHAERFDEALGQIS